MNAIEVGSEEPAARKLSGIEWNNQLQVMTKRCLARLNDLPDYDGISDEVVEDSLLPPS